MWLQGEGCRANGVTHRSQESDVVELEKRKYWHKRNANKIQVQELLSGCRSPLLSCLYWHRCLALPLAPGPSCQLSSLNTLSHTLNTWTGMPGRRSNNFVIRFIRAKGCFWQVIRQFPSSFPFPLSVSSVTTSCTHGRIRGKELQAVSCSK